MAPYRPYSSIYWEYCSKLCPELSNQNLYTNPDETIQFARIWTCTSIKVNRLFCNLVVSLWSWYLQFCWRQNKYDAFRIIFLETNIHIILFSWVIYIAQLIIYSYNISIITIGHDSQTDFITHAVDITLSFTCTKQNYI